jgi:hypothetical protein
MEKVLLNADGIEKKQRELYALPEPQFSNEVQKINSQLKSWLTDNFLLTDDEQHSVSVMTPAMGLYLGAEISGAVKYQFPIVFEKQEKPPLADDGSKRVACIRKSVVPPSKPEKPTGTLQINIYYIT